MMIRARTSSKARNIMVTREFIQISRELKLGSFSRNIMLSRIKSDVLKQISIKGRPLTKMEIRLIIKKHLKRKKQKLKMIYQRRKRNLEIFILRLEDEKRKRRELEHKIREDRIREKSQKDINLLTLWIQSKHVRLEAKLTLSLSNIAMNRMDSDKKTTLADVTEIYTIKNEIHRVKNLQHNTARRISESLYGKT